MLVTVVIRIVLVFQSILAENTVLYKLKHYFVLTYYCNIAYYLYQRGIRLASTGDSTGTLQSKSRNLRKSVVDSDFDPSDF